MRKIGKMNAIIMEIKFIIEQGGKVGVVGCKDAQNVLYRLKALGIDAKSEPMLSGFDGGKKKQTGFVFYKETQNDELL